MRHSLFFTADMLVMALAASLLLADSSIPASASHAGGMDAMSIDMNHVFSPGNSATSLGTRQVQARLNENDVLDADEDIVDSLIIDVTATNIPLSNPMIAFSYVLSWNSPPSPNLCVVDHDYEFLLATSPGPIIDAGDGSQCDGTFLGTSIDIGFAAGVVGTGVLQRLTIESQPDVASGIFTLALDQAAHVDTGQQPQVPDTVNNAAICINVACPDADGDGIEPPDDLCPNLAGPLNNQGCPLAGPPAVGGIAGLLGVSDRPPPADGVASAGAYPWLVLAAVIPGLAAGSWLTVRLVRRWWRIR